MRVEEQGVHAPWERLPSHVEVRILWDRRKLAAMLRFEVFLMLRVFLLNALNPKGRNNSSHSRSEYLRAQ